MITEKEDGAWVSVLSVYGLPSCGWDFYRNIFEVKAANVEGILIWGGDMNILEYIYICVPLFD